MDETKNTYDEFAAAVYDLWFAGDTHEEIEFFSSFLKEMPGPTLEIGCGTGRIMLALIERGFAVEGAEPSLPMLEVLKRKASEKDIQPKLITQRMEDLSIGRTFQSIIIPACSFMLVPDRSKAMEVLCRIREHLVPGGQLLLTSALRWGISDFFTCSRRDTNDLPVWKLRREAHKQDHVILLSEATSSCIPEQICHSRYRYEVFKDGVSVSTHFQQLLVRWYGRDELTDLLKQSGFSDVRVFRAYERKTPTPRDDEFVYHAINK